jgi:NAD(P)H-nitrite reductase large subunit
MRVVIVGAGPAGLTVAETIREHDRTVDILMLSAEAYPPYAPPGMADYFMTGREDTLFWKGRDVSRRLELDFRENIRVHAVRPVSKEVVLENGDSLSYDRLVIATGSGLYAPIEGRDLPGVYDFKSLRAARALVDRMKRNASAKTIIVGAGFIGVELAMLMRALGVEATILEMADRVIPQILDSETAEIVLSALRARGVDVRLNAKAVRFVGARKAGGVQLESGPVLKADGYVAATGVKPQVEFLAGSGIELGWGVRVDQRLCTNIPDIYAAGDVAETYDRLTGERYVHANFPNAVAQAKVVALNLLGGDTRYEGAETMNSLKHLGLPVMAVGAMNGEERLRSRDGEALRSIFLSGGRIVGFRLAGDIRVAGVYHALMLTRADVRPMKSRLLDPQFSAGALALEAAAGDLDLRPAR